MTGGAVVLRTLADYQPFTLRAFCPTSGRSVPLDHEALARRFGWDMLLEDIRLYWGHPRENLIRNWARQANNR